MEKYDRLDEQVLGAFVDGQLDTEHSETVIRAMDEDAAVRERVYRLRRSKDLMRLAFATATPVDSTNSHPVRTPFPARLAASVAVLAIGITAGMLGQHYLDHRSLSRAASPVTSVQTQPDGIILHVSKSDPVQFEAALAYTEKFLDEHDETHQIEVVAHASGLDMLRADISPVRDRIVSLMQRHGNVHFVGCAGAIRTYTLDHGMPPRIIAGVATDMTAFDHIVNHLQSGGWTYIKAETLPEV